MQFWAVAMSNHQQQAIEIMQRSSVIPREFRESAINFQRTPYTDRIDRYITSIVDGGHCLVLAGAPARGKTFAGYYALCLAATINRRVSVSAYNIRTLIGYAISDTDVFRHAIGRHGLTLWDDLGTEHRSDSGWSDGLLCEMIDTRYTNRLPTIITTNVSYKAARLRYDERIMSRLQGWGWWCEFPPDQTPALRVTPKNGGDDE